MLKKYVYMKEKYFSKINAQLAKEMLYFYVTFKGLQYKCQEKRDLDKRVNPFAAGG